MVKAMSELMKKNSREETHAKIADDTRKRDKIKKKKSGLMDWGGVYKKGLLFFLIPAFSVARPITRGISAAQAVVCSCVPP